MTLYVLYLKRESWFYSNSTVQLQRDFVMSIEKKSRTGKRITFKQSSILVLCKY